VALSPGDARHIWLLRHADAVSAGPGQSDHQRGLSHHGTAAAAQVGGWLAQQPHAPEWIWSSDALRAQQTATPLAEAVPAPMIAESALYLASAEQLLACLQATPPELARVALVAHNPGITYLLNLLGANSVTTGMPTAGLGYVRFNGDWSALRWHGAECARLAPTPFTTADGNR